MSNAEVTNSEPALVVKDVEGMMEELSRQLSPPEGGRLRGEVLSTFSDGRGVHLRDAGRATVEVRIDQPLKAERGDFVEVTGVPELVAAAAPVGLRVVWRGDAAYNRGVSERFRQRRVNVEACAARLPFNTPRIGTRLRNGGRVRVVTEPGSKAWEEVAEAARQYRWFKPDPRFCEDMRDAGAVAAALESFLETVTPRDVVLVAWGGAERADLDVFEEERVVGALARLTERCPTVLAVGHSGDELMTNKVVTYPVDAAAGAVQLILRESGGGYEVPAEEERISAPPEVAAPRPRPPSGKSPVAMVANVVLLAAAVYLGWWARGFFQPTDEALRQAKVSAPG